LKDGRVVPVELTASHTSPVLLSDRRLAEEAGETSRDEMKRLSRDIMTQLKDALKEERDRLRDAGLDENQATLAGTWVPLQVRRSGSRDVQRFIGYVPRRAPYITLWQLNGEKSGQCRFY